MDYFDIIPVEIIYNICDFLAYEDITDMMKSCNRLYNNCYSQWYEKHLIKYGPHTYDKVKIKKIKSALITGFSYLVDVNDILDDIVNKVLKNLNYDLSDQLVVFTLNLNRYFINKMSAIVDDLPVGKIDVDINEVKQRLLTKCFKQLINKIHGNHTLRILCNIIDDLIQAHVVRRNNVYRMCSSQLN